METSSNNNNNATATQQSASAEPSLIHGHVQYVKGVVESAVGSVTGSQAWKESGDADCRQAVAEMNTADGRDANDRQSRYATAESTHSSGTALKVEGQLEKVAGTATFCGGMKRVGDEKIHEGEKLSEHNKLH
ncbi:hypothetical protein RI367_004189 [Sorochytrium milnesiophthora]